AQPPPRDPVAAGAPDGDAGGLAAGGLDGGVPGAGGSDGGAAGPGGGGSSVGGGVVALASAGRCVISWVTFRAGSPSGFHSMWLAPRSVPVATARSTCPSW